MDSAITTATPVDFSDPVDADHTRRIGRAWVELRRGAWTQHRRDYLFGDEAPIEPGQMDALDLLARGDRSMSQLAERLRIDPSSATRAVQRLIADGLAERYTAPADGRVVMVRITEDALARHAEVAARRRLAMEYLLKDFTPEERGEFADLLDRFVAALDNSLTHL